MRIGSTPITDIKIGSTQITKVIRNGITYWEVTTTTISPTTTLVGIYGETYYVKNGGNDSLDGLSDANAWATITKVNSATFLPGDGVLFERGGKWREELKVPSNGNTTHYITFGNYGNPSSKNPRILGSNISTGWTETTPGSNIWKSDGTFADLLVVYPYYTQVFFVETNGSVTWGYRRANTSSLTIEYDWVWASNYIYVYSVTNPSIRYTSVEIPQRYDSIQLNDKQYINIDGIDMFYAKFEGVSYLTYPMRDLSGLIIQNLEIAYLGSRIPSEGNGFGTSAVYSDMVIRNCTIHDCGRRSVSLNMYASGFTAENILVEGCTFYHGTHTTSVDISMGSSSSYTSSFNNITIRNNLVWDEPNWPYHSVQLFVEDSHLSTGTLNNVYIYNNIFKYPTGGSVQFEYPDGMFIYHNTFYGHNINGNGNTVFIWPYYPKNLVVKNNIFYTLLSSDTNAAGVSLFGSDQNLSETDVNYNLYYRINNNIRIISAGTAYYHMNDKTLINSALGWEYNGVFADPLFVDGANDDFHLQSTSPAINNGTIDARLIRTVDRDGNPIVGLPDIGAYEHGLIVTTTAGPTTTAP